MSAHRVCGGDAFQEAVEGSYDCDETNSSCSNGMQSKEVGLVRVDGCEDGSVDEDAPSEGHELMVVPHEYASMEKSARHIISIEY